MSFDIFAEYATDEGLENNGTVFKIGNKGATLLIARSGNRKYGKALTRQVEMNRPTLDLADEAADELSDQIMVNVMAETILLGWTGVSFKGEEMPYSIENAKKLLVVKDFRRQVAQFSDDVSAYKIKTEAQQTGN